MKAFVSFLAYFFGCLLLAALLLPVVQPALASAFGDSATPSRSLYRLAMLLMLAGFPWFLRRQHLLGWRLVGFTLPARAAWAAVLKGLAVGAAILAVLVLGLLLTGAREPAPPDDFGVGDLTRVVLIGGLLVGLIEEIFFRGMMHTAMRRTLAFWPTALLTAGFYAAVHFMRPAPLYPGAELDLPASLQMLGLGLANLADIGRIHDSFAALLVAGLLLSMVRERSGNILWCIGIHAGWVMVVKTTKYLTDTNLSQGHPVWIGHYDDITGLLAALWLTLLATGYWYASRREN